MQWETGIHGPNAKEDKKKKKIGSRHDTRVVWSARFLSHVMFHINGLLGTASAS
jgi:hypothetical protein